MSCHTTATRQHGFTMTELLTVMGLVTLLFSLLVPVISKVKAASSNTTCLSNLRQMGTAWTAYTMEHHGRLPTYMWRSPTLAPEAAWKGYWPGIIEANGITPETMLCPAAREPATEKTKGFGNATRAWNGRYVLDGSTAVRLSDTTYRSSSYGYNRYLTAGTGAARGGGGNCLAAVPNWTSTPLLFDSAFADALPLISTESVPVKPPPDLTGASVNEGSPQHWRFLLGRHGRGINVAMADGSAKWVRLDDVYQLTWNGDWMPYRLPLPSK